MAAVLWRLWRSSILAYGQSLVKKKICSKHPVLLADTGLSLAALSVSESQTQQEPYWGLDLTGVVVLQIIKNINLFLRVWKNLLLEVIGVLWAQCSSQFLSLISYVTKWLLVSDPVNKVSGAGCLSIGQCCGCSTIQHWQNYSRLFFTLCVHLYLFHFWCLLSV